MIGERRKLQTGCVYRMCDELVAAIKDSPALLQTHMSRYEENADQLYEDPAHHVLAL